MKLLAHHFAAKPSRLDYAALLRDAKDRHQQAMVLQMAIREADRTGNADLMNWARGEYHRRGLTML